MFASVLLSTLLLHDFASALQEQLRDAAARAGGVAAAASAAAATAGARAGAGGCAAGAPADGARWRCCQCPLLVGGLLLVLVMVLLKALLMCT